MERSVKLRAHVYNMGPSRYLVQGALSVMKKFPKSIDVWRTGHIHSHSNDSNLFQDKRHRLRGGDITKANIQTSGGDLSLEALGQAIS